MKTKKLTIKIAKTIFIFYWICLVSLWPLAPILVRPVRAAEVTLDYNDISVDGQVYFSDPSYLRSSTGTTIVLGRAGIPPYSFNRGYIDWNTSDIPDGSTINSVSLIVYISYAYGAGDTVDIKQMDNVSTSWVDDNSGNESFFNYIASETTVYVDNDTNFQSIGSKTISLGSTAVSDLQSQLEGNWFSLSLYGSDESANRLYVESENSSTPANRPQLLVNYTEGGGGGPVPEFTTTGMLIAVFGSLAGYVLLQRQWNMAEERKRSLRN